MEDSEIINGINGIYDRFETPSSLRMHMFRVAAVGDMICQNWKNDSIRINRDEIVAACLLHDLGNIAKMGMRKEEELRMMGGEAVNAAHWIDVRERIVKRYGRTPDEVTLRMAKEINASQRLIFIIEYGGAGQLLLGNSIMETRDWALKILSYCDCRVTPFGITSAVERVEDLRKRYGESSEAYRKNVGYIEEQIFSNTNIEPDQINDGSAAYYISGYQKQ